MLFAFRFSDLSSSALVSGWWSLNLPSLKSWMKPHKFVVVSRSWVSLTHYLKQGWHKKQPIFKPSFIRFYPAEKNLDFPSLS